MHRNKKTEFLELYNKLPASIQDFLASDKMGIIIDDALNLAKVSSEKFSSVMDIITEILSFQLSKDQFKNELERRINISPVAAQIVNKVIEEKIFKIFEKELNQYKPQSLKQRIPSIQQEIESKKSTEPSEPPKIKPATKENIEEAVREEVSSEQIIPEYSFPEASEVKVEKPVSKIEELKKVVTPKVPPEQQEKIREKLLAAMQNKDIQPEIIEKMKKVSFKKPAPKEKKEPLLKKKAMEEVAPSKILSGEGEKFKDEEVFEKSKTEKPYILGAKLKEEKEKKEQIDISEEPIPYKKYQKENPFGQA